MKQITNNPYRIIGILAGTGIRERTKRISRLKMLIEAEAVESDDYSFPHLGEIERTAESLDNAVSSIDLDKDKLKAALFWFCSISHTDGPAFEMLKENNIDGCIEIWSKQTASGNISKSNVSAYLNLSTISLWNALSNGKVDPLLFRKGMNLKLKFLDSEFSNEIVKLSTDENYRIRQAEVQKLFLSGVYEEVLRLGNGFEPEFWKILKEMEFIAKADFEKEVIKDTIELIEKMVEDSRNSRNEDITRAIEIGNKLLNGVKEHYEKVKKILGEGDLKFIALSDKISNESSQCAIQYFNHFRETDNDPGVESEDLILRSKKFALGKITIERLESNCEVINEWNNERESREKYKEISHLIKQIETEIASFKAEKKNVNLVNVNRVISLIKICTRWLVNIGKKYGFSDSKYISLSTTIAREMQNYLVEKFDYTLEQWSNGSIDIETVRIRIHDINLGMLYVDTLDMDEGFSENTFSKNYYAIRDTCIYAGISTIDGFRKISSTYEKQPFVDNGVYLTREPLTKRKRIVRNMVVSTLIVTFILLIALIISPRTDDNLSRMPDAKNKNVKTINELYFVSEIKNGQEIERNEKYLFENKGSYIMAILKTSKPIGVSTVDLIIDRELSGARQLVETKTYNLSASSKTFYFEKISFPNSGSYKVKIAKLDGTIIAESKIRIDFKKSKK